MKNIIIGLILGFVWALPVSAIAFGGTYGYTAFEERVIELLEQIERHGDDISSDTQTLIDAVNNLPRG